jgi:hypothetical protein
MLNTGAPEFYNHNKLKLLSLNGASNTLFNSLQRT